jgi:aspartyl-tRNA(Asn)/glutamyl-tRNA(Gln) amidotransferase subunit B
LVPAAEWVGDLAMLPAERRSRLAAVAPGADVALVVERGMDDLVLAAVELGADPNLALTHAVHNLSPDAALPSAADFARLVELQSSGSLTATQAKAVLADLQAGAGSPDDIVRTHGFEAMGSDALAAAVDAAIAARPDDFEALRAGNMKVVGVFVGDVMKATSGKANGKEVTALLRQRAGLT